MAEKPWHKVRSSWLEKFRPCCIIDVIYHTSKSGYSGGLIPLLDREGKPVISPIMNS